MKTKLFLMVLINLSLSFIQINSQTYGPIRKSLILTIGGSADTLSSYTYPFSGPDSLVLGFQWPNNLSVAKALYCNQNSLFPQFMVDDQFYQPDPNKAQDGAYLTLNGLDATNPANAIHSVFSHNLRDTGLLHVHSMTWEPNMQINTGDNQYQILAKRPDDQTRPIFGMGYVYGNVPSSGANYSFLEIPNSSYINQVIFSEPWGSEFLWRSFWEEDDIDSSLKSQRVFHGYNMLVSINLKRLGGSPAGYGLNDTILEIVLPYNLHNSSVIDSIKFDALPTSNRERIETTFSGFRGYKTIMQDANAPTKKFYILKSMIPPDYSAVTITARFRCWGMGGDDEFKNPKLSSPVTKSNQEIEKLGITAKYKGGWPIAVEYVRISSLHTIDLLEGKCDTFICKWLQQDIDLINDYNEALPEKKLKIFKFNDITEADVQNYAAARYVRELIGDVFSGSNSPKLPVLFDHYVKPSGRVYGFGTVNPCINASYIKQGQKYVADSSQGLIEDRWKSLGFICGSTQKNNWTVRLTLEEQLNSGYETFYPYKPYPSPDTYTYNDFLPGNINIDKIYGLKCTGGNDSPFNSFQAFHQFNLWYLFANDTASGFQYLDKPWYFQTQNLTEWTKAKYTCNRNSTQWTNLDLNSDSLKYSYKSDSVSVEFEASTIYSYGRPYTAEELRAVTYSALGQGAKGLLYDGLSYVGRGTEYAIRSAHNKALLDNPLEADDDLYDYLMRDEYGGDFFNFANEGNPNNPLYFHFFPSLYINMLKSTVDKDAFMMENLGVHYNRVYIGRKSTRIELHKIHRLLMENASTIMNLRLQAAYGKGFFKTYTQHTSITTDTIMDTYICMDSIKTRKKYQPYTPGTNQGYLQVSDNQKEIPEETFLDVSILKENNTNMQDRWYAFCQNRRTDPLLWRNMHDGIPLEQTVGDQFQIKFYSDSELDLWCDSGGVDPYSLYSHDKYYWRNLYEKRFGFRILELPLRRTFRNFNERLFGFYIKELTYQYPEFGSTDFDSMRYWLKYEYDNKIDDIYLVCQYSIYGYENIDVPLQPGRGKYLSIEPIYQKNNFEILSPKPFINPLVVDTCMYLRENVELIFKRADSSDANKCIYEIYCVNKSDTFNIYVPIIAEFTTYNDLDTTKDIPSGFQYFNYRKDSTFTSAWFPDTVMQDTTFLATYNAHCSDGRVSYKIGTRMCYIEAFLDLPCGICECSDSLSLGIQPVTLQNFCRVYPTPYQRLNLNSDEDCDYYGILVTGGFSPMDSTIISALSIMPDTTNPQPIDISAYNRYIEDPFLNIYCPTVCSYCLHFAFLGSEGQILCEKDFCITIDNTQYPIDIDPYGILSSQCYSIQPAKRAVPSEEIHSGQMIIVDPNPTTGKATVKLNLENDLSGRLVLYTATGELIQEIHNGKLSKGSTDYQIDLSSQPSGMYIITIESDGMQYIKKFVKE